MRSAFLVLVLAVPLALAGCADEANDDPTEDVPVVEVPALQAVIAVSLNGTAAQAANGTVVIPLGLAATFDGSPSTGAILTYAWDFGDNSTGSDRTEEHLFEVPGLYNVTLTVANGNLTSNATLAVTVVGVAAGTFLETQSFTFDGELPLMNPNSCTNQGVDCQDHTIPIVAEVNGTAAVAKSARITVVGEGDAAVDMQVFWRSPDGTNLASTGASGLEHAIEFTEPMPAGDYAVRVRLFVGAGATYTGSVEIDYVTV